MILGKVRRELVIKIRNPNTFMGGIYKPFSTTNL